MTYYSESILPLEHAKWIRDHVITAIYAHHGEILLVAPPTWLKVNSGLGWYVHSPEVNGNIVSLNPGIKGDLDWHEKSLEGNR